MRPKTLARALTAIGTAWLTYGLMWTQIGTELVHTTLTSICKFTKGKHSMPKYWLPWAKSKHSLSFQIGFTYDKTI